MAKVCDICNKGRMSGNAVSHSNRKARRVWIPNLKKVRVVDNGSHKTLNVCTRCIRTGKIKNSL
ncbi:MAG TPA: 50S ribosomal protein L28 [Candidatus Atribacteria bacterium]|mgnify:CR=1 FL=1|nr:50S ribosomal protein L28 [Candidatus Atribacteria bacterium]HPT77800.1 50S ribosomal protein L28 [Candidatus Atribacteria bacterium]